MHRKLGLTCWIKDYSKIYVIVYVVFDSFILQEMRHTVLLFLVVVAGAATGQTHKLFDAVTRITSTMKADIGVAIYNLETGDTLSVNGGHHYPMQSVYKFHLALAVLDLVDRGKLSLQQEIFVSKDDLRPDTWSPMRDQYPDGNMKLRLGEVLAYTTAQSDNNGCDILFRLIGGPGVVQDYLRRIGVNDVSIKATEFEMAQGWDVQFSNWTTPVAAAKLLAQFYQGQLLKKDTGDFLMRILTETTTGPKRLKGMLPAQTSVAHKTGTSGTSGEGIMAAVNDIGIVASKKNGQAFVIVVFVSNTFEELAASEQIIASVAKAAWDFFSENK